MELEIEQTFRDTNSVYKIELAFLKGRRPDPRNYRRIPISKGRPFRIYTKRQNRFTNRHERAKINVPLKNYSPKY